MDWAPGPPCRNGRLEIDRIEAVDGRPIASHELAFDFGLRDYRMRDRYWSIPRSYWEAPPPMDAGETTHNGGRSPLGRYRVGSLLPRDRHLGMGC
jgi:hypothetical protein